ncbi:Isochorismate pyruvate lyase [Roseobacter fucihabitans]|uniref:chorismate mutase n=1 Tax=Roseobacter fucihabitans TaxID=1537242 RepID=A0ABZ2BUP4_9RHOB|nr:chorismate mutase [Roseobacter litoralis]MBC6966121.1 Salicylate biosynthesis protein PchB [Roseobacter litoralis]
MTDLMPPKDCASMADLRRQIDLIDTMLLDLLATRSQYIDRAIDLKRIEGLPARIVERVAEVLQNVTSKAAHIGLDEKLAETLWSELIEWSIERESKHLG